VAEAKYCDCVRVLLVTFFCSAGDFTISWDIFCFCTTPSLVSSPW